MKMQQHSLSAKAGNLIKRMLSEKSFVSRKHLNERHIQSCQTISGRVFFAVHCNFFARFCEFDCFPRSGDGLASLGGLSGLRRPLDRKKKKKLTTSDIKRK